MPIIRLVTELDALLDTRLGLMDALEPDFAVSLAKNPEYYTRETDRFEELCQFPDDIYAGEWAKRDKRALQHALATPAVDMVKVHMLELHRQSLRDHSIQGIELEVNVFPYVLTEEEKAEYHAVLRHVIGTFFTLYVVDRPWSFYSPTKLRADYAGLIVYNHWSWMQANYDELKVRGCPQVSMVAPKLFATPLNPEDRIVEGKEVDPFYVATMTSRHLIGFEFIDVANFCLPHTPKLTA